MRAARILRDCLRGMLRQPMRTGLMLLGTFAGVCALTILVAVGRGTQSELLRRMEQMLSGSSVFVRAGSHQLRGGVRFGAVPTTLTLADVRALEQEVAAVALADPLVAADIETRGTARRQRVEGHSEKAEIVWNRSVTRGRYFTADEVTSAARVALIGEVVAQREFAGRDPIGQEIRVGNAPFRVIGVLAPAGIDPHGINKDDEIAIPITTMLRRVLEQEHLLGARLALRKGYDVSAAAEAVASVLRRRHGIAPGQPDDFATFTPMQVQRVIRSTNRVFTLFLPLLAGVVIIVGGLVVANLMLLTVNERRAEIGLRKAVGARARDIRLQFFTESIAVTALGALGAVAVAYVALPLFGARQGAVPPMPWDAAMLGLTSAVLVGVAAGVLPARRAAALDPARTLR